MFRVIALCICLVGSVVAAKAEPILIGSVTFDENVDLYTYNYVLSGVDEGRKVTSVAWVVSESNEAPAYLPLSVSTPYYWNFSAGSHGPHPGGVWYSATGDSDNGVQLPISDTWGTLLANQTRTFSFTTGYAPRQGQYYIAENAVGAEQNYLYLLGLTVVPDYDGSLAETLAINRWGLSIPPPQQVSEPSTLLMLSIGALAFVRRRSRSV